MSYLNDIAAIELSTLQGTFSARKSNVEAQDLHYGPENKRECPCDTCPMAAACLEKATECSAFRNWCSKGNYKDADVQRLLRAA